MPERPPSPPRPVVEAETSKLGPRVTPEPAAAPAAAPEQTDGPLPSPGWMSGPLAASASKGLSSSGGSPAIARPRDGELPSDPAGKPGSERGGRESRSSRPSGRPVNERVGEIVAERYRIERLLGEGGMGAVYEVEHTHMRKRFALKVLHADMSRLPEVVARFEREAMAAAHIDHANVAGATDFGKLPDGSFYLVLEYVEGRSLRRVIDKEAPIDQTRALYIVRQIALALDRAHGMGIVHRDLKPENVMLVAKPGEPEVVKVLDFGIAKVPLGELLKNSELGVQPVLTQMGMVYGTPEYMAPEQALGQEVDLRADLYALGVITFELLAGVRPYEADSKVALLGMHVTAPIPTIASKAPDVGARLTPAIEPMIHQLLAKEMVDRTPSSHALIEEIDGALRELGSPLAPTSGPHGGQMNRGVASGSTPPRSLGANEAAVANVPVTQRFTPMQHAATELPKAQHAQKAGKWVAIVAAGVGVALVAGAVTLFTLTSHKVHDAEQSALEAGATGAPQADSDAASGTTATSAAGSASATAIVPETAADAGAAAGDPATAAQHHAAALNAARAKDWSTVVSEVSATVRADPGAVQDDSLLELLRNAALNPKSRESALGLAVTMGSRGGGLLYNVAYSQWSKRYPWSQGRAASLLATDPMRHQVAPEVDIALSLRELQPLRTCETPTLYPRVREVGDEKALAILQPLAANKKLACLHQDSALDDTISTLKARIAANAKKP